VVPGVVDFSGYAIDRHRRKALMLRTGRPQHPGVGTVEIEQFVLCADEIQVDERSIHVIDVRLQDELTRIGKDLFKAAAIRVHAIDTRWAEHLQLPFRRLELKDSPTRANRIRENDLGITSVKITLTNDRAKGPGEGVEVEHECVDLTGQ
jgi:hypothetical protein